MVSKEGKSEGGARGSKEVKLSEKGGGQVERRE